MSRILKLHPSQRPRYCHNFHSHTTGSHRKSPAIFLNNSTPTTSCKGPRTTHMTNHRSICVDNNVFHRRILVDQCQYFSLHCHWIILFTFSVKRDNDFEEGMEIYWHFYPFLTIHYILHRTHFLNYVFRPTHPRPSGRVTGPYQNTAGE